MQPAWVIGKPISLATQTFAARIDRHLLERCPAISALVRGAAMAVSARAFGSNAVGARPSPR